MKVVVTDLDRNIKEKIADIIMTAILKQYGTLPLPEQSEFIYSVVQSPLKNRLSSEIADWYSGFDNNISVELSDDDYVNIYLKKI